MSIGLGIFLSTLLVVIVLSLRRLAQTIPPKVLLKKLSIWLGGGAALLVALASGLWGYNYYTHIPSKQTAYYGVSLGMSKEEVQYVLGTPDSVQAKSGWESVENLDTFQKWASALTEYILKQSTELSSYTPKSLRSQYSDLSDRRYISALYQTYLPKHPEFKKTFDEIESKFTKNSSIVGVDKDDNWNIWEFDTTKTSELPKGKSVFDYSSWSYEAGNSEDNVTVNFDSVTNTVTQIHCGKFKLGESCKSILGISPFSSEDDLLNQLGSPSSQKITGPTKTLCYDKLNLEFYLSQRNVYLLKVTAKCSI